jgi:nitrate reductase gamma subunit
MLKRVNVCSDWVLLYLLTAQAATGVYIAVFMRWGSHWYLHTAVPYFYSLFTFTPQVEYVADFPLIFKLHAAGAFLIVALLPFTKLVHLLYLPVAFLRDPPILYKWRSR